MFRQVFFAPAGFMQQHVRTGHFSYVTDKFEIILQTFVYNKQEKNKIT